MTSIPVPPLLPGPLLQVGRSIVKEEKNEDLCFEDLDRFLSKIITKIKPIIQSGPNCGIVALAMASSTRSTAWTVKGIFQRAKALGFTNNGEMFSAHDMSVLASEVCEPWFHVELLTGSTNTNWAHVVDSLTKGELMLIPYDADFNHSPCCKNGHKAHWALVCGILTDDEDLVWVAARHGTSKYLSIWPLMDLRLSNDNLMELDPKRANDERDYILPPGGVEAGLCSQFILLHRKD